MARLQADEAVVHPECHISGSVLGAYVEIGAGTRLAHVNMGDYSYCDRFCDLANVRVGKFCNIASFVRIGATDHPIEKASLHHFLYRSASYWDDESDDAAWFAKRAGRIAHIGHDTWIGHGAMIKPEVTIGTGAIVAAGAIVTKDVAPYTIVGGNTAQLIRKRFDDQIAERLQALAWWDWSHAALQAALPDFRALPIEAFLEKYE
ncbi:chloramphenicol acetyltransferase [Epibacterium sp. SM1969]|uniref:Chloramphenicol acetyltransferase n=1 Tax=Tritonibacter aquimaris TaxID=2663379 RepID=A0A844AYQ1_9RHOB|nr:chloramphenicol acetyltransferase [Tritonibacter aquimaris]MQY42296.1 chloramphenicol acetyltransferase [Tritonibacter aquimaris]